MLDDVADGAPEVDRGSLLHRLAVDGHLAMVRLDEAVDHLDERRLAAAGSAEDRDELAARDLHVDVVNGVRVGEALRHPAERDHARSATQSRMRPNGSARTRLTVHPASPMSAASASGRCL